MSLPVMSRTIRGAVLAATLLVGSAASAQPPEGVKVHGDWTIEVRNADGTPAATHRFRNALEGGGKEILARLLTGQEPPPQWRIVLETFCFGCSQLPKAWSFQPAMYADSLRPPLTTSHINFFNLTSRREGSSVVLEASGSTATGAWFTEMFTQLLYCTSDACQTQTFSAKAASLVINEGQIVQVRVVFNFS